jgi:hypothetical protein
MLNLGRWTHSHGSMVDGSHRFSVTLVFYSNELTRSPDDYPKGSKHVVTMNTT